jgi:TonB family protein
VPPPVRTPARPQPKPTPIEEPKEEKPKPEPTKGPDPKPDSQGGENLNVDIQGQDFPYPEYLDHVIAEINRHFRGWEGSTKLKVQVFFYINRDGTVGGLDVLQRSGNFNFDLKAMSAVEAAGNRGAFGPLPEGWVQDRLYIRYTFLPPGG